MVAQCAEEQLEFDFEFGCPSIEAEYYRDGAQDLIRKLVPADLLEEEGGHLASKRARFSDLLPVISWSELDKAPCSLSVVFLCKYRLNACNFFYDMVSRWLLPNKRINVELFFASDVRLPHLSDELLSVAEIVIYLKSIQDVEEVRRNIHSIETEIRLGAVSHYHARRILEFKGLSADGKTAMIQEKISSLIQSHSKDFDSGIFSQMQQFLVTCPEDFKTQRDYHHISRLISNMYSLRKVLKQNSGGAAVKRHVVVKFMKTQLKRGREEKTVLGVLLGLNFLNEHEIFESNQLLTLVQKQVPMAKLVEGSAFADRVSDSLIQTTYLEVEKKDGSDFSLEDVQKLRVALPYDVKANVEPLARPIFMPRNDEEVLRNIMALSRQLRFLHDRPQVIISFDEQKGQDLCFTVILLRLISEGDTSVQQLFASSNSELKYVPDRVRRVGQIRRKIKEATVFRTTIASCDFLRSDQFIDLYKARASILSELQRVIGDLRDYNGGMIYKQAEQISALKQALGRTADPNHLLIEKFFYSLLPMEMRTTLDTESLKQFFLLLFQSMKTDLKQKCLTKKEARRSIAIFSDFHPAERKKIADGVESLRIPAHQLVSFSLEVGDRPFIGYLLLSEEEDLQNRFLSMIPSLYQ